jgi:hypothetical protein
LCHDRAVYRRGDRCSHMYKTVLLRLRRERSSSDGGRARSQLIGDDDGLRGVTSNPSSFEKAIALIRRMATADPLWGAPRIHGELLKLGIDISQATVATYMPRRRRPPSQTWRTFLANHVGQIMAADFFVVPTVTYRLLFVLVILAHHRRRIVHIAVTAHPTAAWTAQQLREAFPEDAAPRYLVHDRDHAFAVVAATARGMGIQEIRRPDYRTVSDRVQHHDEQHAAVIQSTACISDQRTINPSTRMDFSVGTAVPPRRSVRLCSVC